MMFEQSGVFEQSGERQIRGQLVVDACGSGGGDGDIHVLLGG